MMLLYWYTNTFLFCLCSHCPRGRVLFLRVLLYTQVLAASFGLFQPPAFRYFAVREQRSPCPAKRSGVHGPSSAAEGEEQCFTWGLKASLGLFLVVNPCFSGQDAVKCPGPAAAWLPEEPRYLVLALGVMVGDQQHQGSPSTLPLVAFGGTYGHCALAEDARPLLPPKQVPRHQKLSAARGCEVVCCGHFQHKRAPESTLKDGECRKSFLSGSLVLNLPKHCPLCEDRGHWEWGEHTDQWSNGDIFL